MNVAQLKPNISYKDLKRIDVRVGTIIKLENIEKSDKLVKQTVDFGDHTRNVVVGMKQEREDPTKDLQALFVVNMEPKEIMGEMSEAMLFDIGYDDGIVPVLAVPEKSVPNGVRVG